MVFQDSALPQVQGARSRGFGRNNSKLPDPGKRVLEDPLSSLPDRNIWLFAGTFPNRDSSYNTHHFLILSPLAPEEPGHRVPD